MKISSLLQEVGQPRGAAPFAGVLLHGRGIGPQGKVDLAARLGHLDGIRWVVPGSDVGSWYPNRFWDPVEANEPFLSEAVEQCEAAVVEASEEGRLPADRLAVVGFSQGACVALEYALRHPGRCGTLIVFTGGLMGPPGTHPKPPAPSLKGLRVLLTGSDVDEWIPEPSTRETAQVLAALGAEVTLRVYPGRKHVINEEEIAEAKALLQRR